MARARCNIASKQIDEKQRELADYEAETIKVIRGQSKLSIDLLNDLVAKAKEEIVSLTATLTDARDELDRCLAGAEAQKQEYAQLETWAEIYARCTFEAQKMIVSQFVKSVYVYKDYSLEVEFNVAFEDFQNLVAECSGLRQTEPDIYVTTNTKKMFQPQNGNRALGNSKCAIGSGLDIEDVGGDGGNRTDHIITLMCQEASQNTIYCASIEPFVP